MKKAKRRFISLLIGFFILIFTYAYVYMMGMSFFEDENIRYYVAVQKTVESITTAGFGGHAPWESLGMNIIVIIMNLTGVTLFFFGVPIALSPFLGPKIRDIVSNEPPEQSLNKNHIIVVGYDDSDSVLVDNLKKNGVDYTIVTEDKKRAVELDKEGHDVVFGSIESEDTLKSANIEESESVIVNVSDELNPSILLAARRYGGNTNIVSVTRGTGVGNYHKLSGADSVFKSKDNFGRALGLRSVLDVGKELEEETDSKKVSTETKIIKKSDDIVGEHIRDADKYIDSPIICGWFNGLFLVNPDPGRKIVENTILITLTNDEKKTQHPHSHDDESSREVLVLGYGTVGKKVEETVENYGFNTTTVDKKNPSSDIVGDISDEEVLRECNIQDAESIVITIDDDTDIINTILMASDISPDSEIVSRVNEKKNLWKVYESGADYSLSLESHIGNALSDIVIDEKKSISPSRDFTIESIEGDKYANQKIKNIEFRGDEDRFVILIERGDDMIVDIDGDTKVLPEDRLILTVG